MNTFYFLTVLISMAWMLYLIFHATTRYNIFYVVNVIMMFIPVVNIGYITIVSIWMFCDDLVELKPTKLNKFLFGTK